MQNTAKGQITLVSISDGSTALFYIDESASTQQIYNTAVESWYPDYEADGNSLKLTPYLTINGTVPSSVKYYWYDATSGTESLLGSSEDGNSVVSTESSTLGMLTINKNLTVQQRFLKCKATFNDPTTGALSTAYETVVLSRTDTAGSSVNVLLDCVTPNTVNSGIDGLSVVGAAGSIDKENDHVQLLATTLLGTSVYVNGTPGDGLTKGAIKYSWSYYNFHLNAFTPFGTHGAESSTGVLNTDPTSYGDVKYYKRNDNEGTSGTVDENYSFESCTSTDSWTVKIQNNTMYLAADAIDVSESIRCTAYLYEVNTAGTAKADYKGEDSDIQAVYDITDDYQLDINASSTVLSSSVPSTILTANITHDGKELTSSSYSRILFDWDAFKYDTTSGTASYVEWPEYTLSDGIFTKITEGTAENGTGYWLSGSTLVGGDQTISASTTGLVYEVTGGKGKNTITVYKDQVGANSRIEVIAYLKGVTE